MNLSDELRAQLIESAAWGKAGITPRLTEETTEEVVDEKKSKKDKEDDVVCEEAAHACPLCASELSEAIDEERLLEHLDIVVGLVDRLSQLQEGDEDVDTVIDETIAELLLQHEEE